MIEQLDFDQECGMLLGLEGSSGDSAVAMGEFSLS